jgi:DNA-binding CsgD family transcriptional regulator
MQFTIDQNQKNIFDSLRGLVGCKDLNSVFLYGNKENANLVGLKNSEDMVGRHQSDFPCEAVVNSSKVWTAQDTIVISEKTPLEILDVHPFITGWKAYITRKTPLWNENKTEVMGTIYHMVDVTRDSVLKVFHALAKRIGKTSNELLEGQNSRILTNNINKPSLTVRQTEVLFLVLFGRSSKEIERILKISNKTVASHIEDLKEKFCASSKSELVDKAYSLGIEKFIPKSLFNKQLSLIIE